MKENELRNKLNEAQRRQALSEKAADTIDLESLKAVDYGTIERLSKDIEKTAQKCQRLAKGKEADE